MNADFDPIETSIRRRADDVQITPPDFATVLAHRQQRVRRRSGVVTVGLLTLGVAGLFALGSNGGAQPVDLADGPTDSGMPPVSDGRALDIAGDAAWYCEGRVDPGLGIDGTVGSTMPMPTTTAPTGFEPEVSVPPFSQPNPEATFDSDAGFFRWCTPVDQLIGAASTVVETAPSATEFFAPTTTQVVLGEQEYVVQEGDSPLGVADRFCVGVEALLSYNNMTNADGWPIPGGELLIPPGACIGLNGVPTEAPASTVGLPTTTTSTHVPE